MIFTEQAWQWIDKVVDPLLVKVLLVKIIIDDANDLKHVKSHSDIRKAMFENKLLTQRIAVYIDDETIMNDIERYVEQTD